MLHGERKKSSTTRFTCKNSYIHIIPLLAVSLRVLCDRKSSSMKIADYRNHDELFVVELDPSLIRSLIESGNIIENLFTVRENLYLGSYKFIHMKKGLKKKLECSTMPLCWTYSWATKAETAIIANRPLRISLACISNLPALSLGYNPNGSKPKSPGM